MSISEKEVMAAIPQRSHRFKPIEAVSVFGDKKQSNPDFNYWRSLGEPSILNQIGAVWDVSFQSCQPHHYAVTASTRVKIYNSVSGDEVGSLNCFKDTAYSANFRADGQLLVAGNADAQVRLFKSTGKHPLKIFKGHKGPVRITNFCEDSTKVFSGSDDQTVRCWEIATEECINQFNFHTDNVRCGTTIPHVASSIITGSYDHTVRMFDMRSNTNTMTIDHGDVVESVLAFPSKSILLSAGGTSLKVWDMLQGGRLLANISNHHKSITCMCLSHDYTRLLTGSLDGHVKIYDVGSYQAVHDIKYPAPILSMALSPDEDRHLVVGMTNNTISVRERKSAASRGGVGMEDKNMSNRRRRQSLFNRGREFTANPDDIVIKHNENEALRRYDHYLRKFEHGQALNTALSSFVRTKTPEITVAVLEELNRREVLASALVGKSDQKLIELIKFLARNITKPYFETTLIEVACTLIDTYAPVCRELSEAVRRHFAQLRCVVKREGQSKLEMNRLIGCVEIIDSNSRMQHSK